MNVGISKLTIEAHIQINKYIYVTTYTQPYRYCLIFVQRDPHGLKIHLQG